MLAPRGDTFAKAAGETGHQLFQAGRRHGANRAGAARFAVAALTAEQCVKLLCHYLAVPVQGIEERLQSAISQRLRNPAQVVIRGGQHMRLLIVQVLDTMLDLAQEGIRCA